MTQSPSTPRVVLADPDSASGLADMLHQFMEQTLAESEAKVALARALRGALIIRSQEDRAIAVRIAFLGDRIELEDIGESEPGDLPTITGGFLAVSHVTTGRASPLGALLRRDLTLRTGLGQLPFLLRVLGFMRIETEGAPRARPLAVLVLILVAAATLIWWVYR